MTIIEKIMSHLGRYTDAATRLKTWLTGNGVEVPDGALIDEMAGLLDGVETTAGDNWEITEANHLFYSGSRADIMDKLLRRVKNCTTFESAFYNVMGVDEIDLSSVDLSHIKNMSRAFQNCFAPVVKFGKQTCANPVNFGDAFTSSWVEELDFSEFSANPSSLSSMCSKCTYLKKFNFGALCPNTTSAVGSMFYNCKALEEILNYGAGSAKYAASTFPNGTSSAPCALRRLTFSQDFSGDYHAVRAAVNISYCSFEREGFLEMMESITDVSGLGLTTAQSTITLTGNPCITGTRKDGTACETLTDEDRAIATAKGWTLVE